MKRVLTVLALAVALCYVFVTRPSALPLAEKTSSSHLRVCTANINYSNARIDELTESLISTKSDLYVIPEWAGNNLDLDAFQRKGYEIRLNHPRPGAHGMCLISRNELAVDAQLIESPIDGPCRMPMAIARLKHNSTHLTLLGIHAPPPIPACGNTTAPTLRAIKQWVEQGKLRRSLGRGVVGDDLIVAGDFNAYSFDNEIAGFADSGLVDTYGEANFYYGPTWSPSSWVPSLFRIDYIFSSHRFKVMESHTIELPGSDHRGVVADIAI